MILTITLNPSIDKLYKVDMFQYGEVNRVDAVRNTAGGKGLNVSRVAALLGESVQSMGFVGGHNGQLLVSLLQDTGIQPGFTFTQRETRCCINIWDMRSSTSTELLEPGEPVTEQEQGDFLTSFQSKLPKADVVTISGSLPKGVSPDIYATLIRMTKGAGKPVLLDTSGPTLREAIAAKPTFIKPNADEILQISGGPVTNLAQMVETVKRLHQEGIGIVAVSMGRDGVLVAADEGVYRGKPAAIQAVNTVGCGDSMVAGFAVAMARKKPITDQIRLAVAVSAANALAEGTGFFRESDLQALLPKVTVEKIDE